MNIFFILGGWWISPSTTIYLHLRKKTIYLPLLSFFYILRKEETIF